MKRLVCFPGLLALLIAQFLFFNANAQAPKTGLNPAGGKDWLEMIQDPGVNFYEVQTDFNKYWENRTDYKGNGWKVFKRWEYINQSRVLPDGKLQAPGYVANIYGKYMKDAGKSPSGAWTLQGPSAYVGNNTGQPTGMGRINAIAFHPNDANTIFIGSPSGGFWKTTDGGANWTNLSSNLPTLGVSSILVHPGNPNIIYIGSGDRDANDAIPMGVFRTTDGGATWTQINTGMGNLTVGAMLMHPSDPNTIIAATSGGIFKTSNGGNTWIQKAIGNFKDLHFNPGDPSIVYAVRIVSPSQFYRSPDTGDSWTQITSGIPTAGIGSRMVIGVSPANPAYVYLLQIKSSDATLANILRSTDSGQSFVSVATGPNLLGYACDGDDNSSQANYDLCMTVDPLNVNNVFAGGINNWKSTDAGVTWTISTHWIGNSFGEPCAASVHADQHCFAWSPLNGRLYAGHDGGINYTADGGTTWPQITNNLAITQIYKIGQGAGNVNYSVFGSQDNGDAATIDGTSFVTTSGGDGMECVIDYDNSNFCYNTYYGGITRRSTTGPLGSYSTIAGDGINGIDESGAWVSPYFLHKSNPNTMFLGLENVWRSSNIRSTPSSSVVWTKISDGETENCIAIEQSPADLNVLYALRANSLRRTDNANDPAGSVAWTSCALPGVYDPTDIKAHPANANIVYLTTGYSVFKSSDKGLTWTDISGNLPPLFINCLVLDKNANEGIYIGNQTGVWYKDASLTGWVLFSTGLPPVDIRELEIYYDDITPSNNRIKCGTYGRGMWQSDMIQVNVVNPANFSAFVAGSSQIDLSWTKNPSDNDVVVAWSPIAGTFGQPADGTSYSVGDPIPGGGTVLYVGPATGISHSALTPSTTYYYKAWSVNGSSQYSGGVLPISAATDCSAISSFPYTCSFDNFDCWKVVTNAGEKSWLFGSTTNPTNPPSILTPPYAFFKSNPGSQVYFDSDLISPPFDLSALGSVVLEFNQHYDGDNVWSSIASIYYTTDNGLNWNHLATYTTDKNNSPVALVIPGAAGQSNVKFLWNYFDDAVGSYMWGIDDVQVKECSGIWTGNVSADWHNPGNWCDNTVPTATTDVLIPAGAANMPDISTTAVAYCQDITIHAGASLKMSAANSSLEVKGNWNMFGSFNYGSSSGSAMVWFNGTAPQTTGGTSSSNLKRVTFDNAAGITLTQEIRGDNVWLTNGIVTTTGSGKVNVFGGSVTRTNGWVNGILQKYTFANPSSAYNVTYEIGDAANYTPVNLSFPSGSIVSGGGFSMKTTPGDHAAIVSSTLNPSKSVNRTWAFPLIGISFSSCNATFNFVNGDPDAGTNTNNLVAGQFKSSAWSYPPVGGKTATSTQVTGLASASLGDIQLAEACTAPDIPVLSSSSEPICVGGSTSLSITSGNLNSASSWQWYTGSCGGSPAGSGASINVSPASTTTYYARGEGGCVTPGACASITVNVNPLPTVSCPGNMSKLLTDPPFALSGGSPAGGTYSGTGVSGGNFNPALAGMGTHTITYTYTNGNNCTNTCTFTITVSEGGNTISGNIMWEQDLNLGVNQTTVALSGDQTGSATTNSSGVYSFTYSSGANFNVTPAKNINKLNGVTVADVMAIQQHVANIAPLPAPFKRIAADVNKSNSITTMDATLINQALLGNPAALAQIKTSWRFVPSAYTFPNPNVPWGFPEKIVLTGVSGDVPGQDFKGIKTADVVTTYANPANFGEGAPLVLRTPDVEWKAGDQLSVEFRADQMPDLASFQLALAFDPAQLGFESIQPLEGLSLTADNFGLLNLSQGEIRVVWSQLEGAGVEEAAPVFQLTFSALQSGSRLSDALQVMADVLSPVSYNSAFEESPVKVVFEPAITTGDHGAGRPEFPSLTSVPNPFSGSATILFVLPESCEAELRVYSAEGRILKRISGVYPAGKNAELLELGADTPGGLLYCELVTPFGIRMHRMVFIRNP